jgi:hypothetical protein
VAPRKQYQIRKNYISGWDFKEVGSELVIANRLSKEQLIEYAESVCRSHRSELIIRDDFGKIVEMKMFEGN